MEFGTRRATVEEISKKVSTVKTLKDVKTYRHRIIGGGVRINELWYPTVRPDVDSGELKPSWNVVCVSSNERGNPFVPIIRADEAIKTNILRASGSTDRARSRLRPSEGWLYYIFDREETELKIDVVNYKPSVVKQIVIREHAEDPENQTMLMYGPAFCWDALIHHRYDDNSSKKSWQRHTYEVEVYQKTLKLGGEVSKDIWDSSKYENPWEAINDTDRQLIFTEAELHAIKNCELSLDEISKPLSTNEIFEQLDKFPFNPFAIDSQGNNIMSNPKQIAEKLNELSLPIAGEEMKKLPESIKNDFGNLETSVSDNEVIKMDNNLNRPIFLDVDSEKEEL